MAFLQTLRNHLVQYPSAIAGILVLLAMIALSIYTVIAIPYHEAITRWRGGEGIWLDNPKNARPAWYNLLPGINLPETIMKKTTDDPSLKQVVSSGGLTEVTIRFPVPYTYDGFPQEVSVFIDTPFGNTNPFLELRWRTPDGREIELGEYTVKGNSHVIRLAQERSLRNRLGGHSPQVGLFADPSSEALVSLKGEYELIVEGFIFREGADLDAKLVVYGQVHGLAGTDHLRRDLSLALLWGTPIALTFGLMAAFGATVLTMVIAAIGAWLGGWVDALIQRITEVNLILPLLPILVMIGTFYSRSIWVMLGSVILFSIFGAGIKTYRAIFLQVKESPYIEAARAYGSGHLRIIFVYLLPRVAPILVPQFVVIIPQYVFIEATLALLTLGDPVLPTWGKVMQDALYGGALFNGHYYWLIEPAVLLMVTGLGFAMLGFALDRIFNPRLRGI